MTDTEALHQLAYGSGAEILPDQFATDSAIGTLFKMIRFLAKRVYALEQGK